MRHASGVAVHIGESLEGIDWYQVKADLAADAFDNGRSPQALHASFAHSQHVAIARDGARVVAMARLLNPSTRHSGTGTSLTSCQPSAAPGSATTPTADIRTAKAPLGRGLALFAREQEARNREETDLAWLAARWNPDA
jgi:hypothetical protein